MRLKVRWCLALAGAGILLVPGAVSAATSSGKVDPRAAATSCAQGRALNSRLGASDATYLARFVPCVLRAERAQLGLRYVQSPAASGSLLAQLARLDRLPHETSTAAARAEARAGAKVAVSTCRRRRAFFQVSMGDTAPPPVLTPLEVSRLLGRLFASSRAVIRSPRTVFAVATQPDLLFAHGNPNGASVAVVDYRCA